MLSRYIRSWGGYKLHIGSNLPPKDNVRKEDNSSAPKVSFIWRFHCIAYVHSCSSVDPNFELISPLSTIVTSAVGTSVDRLVDTIDAENNTSSCEVNAKWYIWMMMVTITAWMHSCTQRSHCMERASEQLSWSGWRSNLQSASIVHSPPIASWASVFNQRD